MTSSDKTPRHISTTQTLPAPYAGPWLRFTGFFIDWLLCLVPIAFVSGVVLTTLGAGGGVESQDADVRTTQFKDLFWIPIVAAFFIGYFTFFWARGQSPGMRVVGIQIANPPSGAPGLKRALARSLLAVAFVMSGLFLLVSFFSDSPQGYNSVDLVVIYSSAVVFAAGVLAHLWMIWDRKKQTLQDKALGLVVFGRMARIDQEGKGTPQ